mmetsp:Transcript_19119/g.41677  ORF Transcript_19119/g.41677 Transcript_19119/m.41677 type:complete len:262 (+) Transcript_19119:772-1557(+)
MDEGLTPRIAVRPERLWHALEDAGEDLGCCRHRSRHATQQMQESVSVSGVHLEDVDPILSTGRKVLEQQHGDVYAVEGYGIPEDGVALGIARLARNEASMLNDGANCGGIAVYNGAPQHLWLGKEDAWSRLRGYSRRVLEALAQVAQGLRQQGLHAEGPELRSLGSPLQAGLELTHHRDARLSLDCSHCLVEQGRDHRRRRLGSAVQGQVNSKLALPQYTELAPALQKPLQGPGNIGERPLGLGDDFPSCRFATLPSFLGF